MRQFKMQISSQKMTKTIKKKCRNQLKLHSEKNVPQNFKTVASTFYAK